LKPVDKPVNLFFEPVHCQIRRFAHPFSRFAGKDPAFFQVCKVCTFSLCVRVLASLLDQIDKLAYSGSNRSETVSRLLQAALAADTQVQKGR